jgi:Zn-dependent protease with chaperone function
MNFFERQAVARKQTFRMLVLFGLAVGAIVLAVNIALLVALGFSGGLGQAIPLMVLITLGTLAVIGFSSLYRLASLRSGGEAIAREMGGTPVPEDTTDFQLRRLRNVVEEIAIASGVPVPRIFVLEQEEGINAFAAGYAPADAAVAVTQGALKRLNRDELQGVIAHEFSHILNGDMRLNLRLIGVLFGILVIGLIGQKILQHGGRTRGRGAAGVLLAALALMIIGYAGVFFGRIIKAGISRQREFLADASAVQFTRQTRGIAGALKKIGGLGEGAALHNSEKEEVAHMLFGDGVGYSSLFATHPPLLARIRAMEPGFKPEALKELAARWQLHPPVGLDEDRVLGFDAPAQPPPLPPQRAELLVTPPAVVAQVAAPQADDFRRAGAIAEGLPPLLLAASRSTSGAVPLLFGLLLAAEPEVRERQRFELKARHGESMAGIAVDFAGQCQQLHPMQRLPLAALAFPVLRRRPRPELQQFVDSCYALIHADRRVSVFEYCLGRLLQVQVMEALDPQSGWRPGHRKLSQVTAEIASLFAVMAQAGHPQPAEAQRAYLAGMERVLPRTNTAYVAPAQGALALDAAWERLDELEPPGKELLIEGLVAAISHDNHVAVAEAELLRVVCAALHCPLPPMLESARESSARS